ncbi:MAG: hypothetical protein EOO73_08440 [Myxococcales bacterium]|nr:MAG: hypothetical protein EOO73_08440 [Myxococcales bacterium]
MKVAPWVAVGAVALGLASACGGDSDTTWEGDSAGSSGTAGGAQNGVSGKGGSAGFAGTPLSGSSAGGRAMTGEGGMAHSGGAGRAAESGGAGGEAAAGSAGGEAEAGGGGGAPPSAGGAAGSGSAAGAGAGGAGGDGGDGGDGGEGPLDCEQEAPEPTQLPSCQPSAAAEPCSACLKDRCCLEWQACYGKAPKSVCGYGAAPNAPGQMDCVRECYLDGYPASADPDEVLLTCAETCAGACVYVAKVTNELVACGRYECADECFPVQ